MTHLHILSLPMTLLFTRLTQKCATGLECCSLDLLELLYQNLIIFVDTAVETNPDRLPLSNVIPFKHPLKQPFKHDSSGYVQQVTNGGSQLTLPSPSNTQASLTVSPTWGTTTVLTPQTTPVSLDFNSGSFHVTLPVPSGVIPGQYTLQLTVRITGIHGMMCCDVLRLHVRTEHCVQHNWFRHAM